MSKKTSAIILSSLIVMNQVSEIPFIHANSSISSPVNQEQANKQSQQVIYVTNGEGNLNAGNGTRENPYQNIRKALEQVEDGGTIKIVGTVQYNKHNVDQTTNAALPLMIEKNITIEGASGDTTNDSLSTRAPIQLGADVTFKNMRIEMPNLNQIMPGVQQPAPTPADEGIYKSGRTIYVAGHTLTLDNVNTKLGENIEQNEERPFISGGSFWAKKATGNKSVVNIVNPNQETRFNSIYAGDYWFESNIPFELNLGKKTNNKTIIDNTIHTGGIMNDYRGDVKITIGGSVSPTFDYTKHTGNTDVEINYSQYLPNIEFNGLRTLTLSNQAYVEVKKDSNFEVENLVVRDGSLLDLKSLHGNPIVNGDFTGDDTSAIYLNNDQTLKVNSLASGSIRLNNHSRIPSYTYSIENHVFLSANENSTMELIICEDDIEYGLRVWETVNNGIKEYSLIEATPLTGTVTITGTPKVGQTLAANTTNCQNNAKLSYQWFIDGNEIVGANQPTFTLTSDHVGHSISVRVSSANYTGTITSSAVTVLTNPLTGSVTITGTPKVGEVLTVKIDAFPSDANLTYQWLIDGNEIDGATQSTFTLTSDHVGHSISVRVSSANYTGTITSSAVTVLTNPLTGSVTITGTPKVGEVLTAKIDAFPSDANLTYQWLIDGNEIDGATQSTFTLTSDHVGHSISVRVSSANYTGTITSSTVTTLTNQLTGNVTVMGTPKVGQTLTAHPTNYQNDANLEYQWFANGKQIEGATQSTFTLTSDYIGQSITVTISSPHYVGIITSPPIVEVSSNYVNRVSHFSEVNGKISLDGYSYVKGVAIPNQSDVIQKLKFVNSQTGKQVLTFNISNFYSTGVTKDPNHGNNKINYDWAKFKDVIDISSLPVGEYYIKLYTNAKGNAYDEIITFHSSITGFSFVNQQKQFNFIREGQTLKLKVTTAETSIVDSHVKRINKFSAENGLLTYDGYSYIKGVHIPNQSDIIQKLKFVDAVSGKQVKTYQLNNYYSTAASKDPNHGNNVMNYDWAKFKGTLDISDLDYGEYYIKIYTNAKGKKYDEIINFHSSINDFSYEINGKKFNFIREGSTFKLVVE